MSNPIESLYTTGAMTDAFSAESHVRCMLTFEAALARAEARAEAIPQAAADAIDTACRTAILDVGAIFEQAAITGTHVIPFVSMLGTHVAPVVRPYVHWGATSQDAIDTAFVLQMRDGLDLLDGDLVALGTDLTALADKHRHTLMPGRTLLQQALPIPFGLKAARWLGMVTRQVQIIRDQQSLLALQFGGAAGTLAALGDRGPRIAALIASDLALVLPDMPWHAERDRVAGIAAALAVAAGAMAKIALDLVLLAQTEVGEAAEASAEGKGGSSAMPHKRNPVDATFALAAARLAMGQEHVILAAMTQEHERATGAWQAEWAAIPSLFRYTAGAVARTRSAIAGIQIDAARMQENLHRGGGLLMSQSLATTLAASVGPAEATRIAEGVSRRALEQGTPLRATALTDDQVSVVLSPEEIDRALDPAGYLGCSSTLIDNALRTFHQLLDGQAQR
jgi:3-carboxy-cis,cis-muconate cycloisomerase